MNRRKFLKITGLTALATIFPFEAIAETTWADIQHADDIVVHGDLNVNGSMIVEHEPYYVDVKVNMSNGNDYFALFHADPETGQALYQSEPIYEYKRN